MLIVDLNKRDHFPTLQTENLAQTTLQVLMQKQTDFVIAPSAFMCY